MPVELPVGDHVAFLWAAVATHALVGAALGAALRDEPGWGLVGGVVADVDLLFPAVWTAPLVHRGITHTLLAGGLLAAAVAYRDRSAGVAVAAGYASHLAIDATTPMGVPLLFPLLTAHLGVVLGGHSDAATVLLWAASLAVLSRWRRRRA